MIRLAIGLAAAMVAGSSVSVLGGPSSAPAGSAYALPHNFYGAHLLASDGAEGTRGHRHLRWARHLVGRWGHAKTLLANIDKDSTGPEETWVDYVNACYQLELVPLLRLAGHYDGNRNHWIKPPADAPGDYTSMAQAVKSVVEGLPRSDLCPLYIEVWNEPNLDLEWTGKSNVQEFADFFVHAARAIHSIGDPRIQVLNGGLATSPEWAKKLSQANPGFIRSFDLWSCHPYPMNRPPSFNHHDKTVPPDHDLTIDSYLLELDVLRKLGRGDVKVMITETGWDLGNSVYSDKLGECHPIVDEYNRADYAMRAFRDYWPKWPEIAAVFPFEFCNEGWERFDWVYPDSQTNPDGSPTKPHYQYTVVAALAKPTDATGAINGTVTVAGLGVRLEGAEVTVGEKSFTTDPMGDYFFARIEPGEYTAKIGKAGFQSIQRKVTVAPAKNAVVDAELVATQRAALTGQARSGDDGKPLAGVSVGLEPGGLKATTDQRGQYAFKECVPARYTLTATVTGHYPYEVENVVIAVDQPNRHDFKLGRRPEGLPERNMAKNPSMEAGGGGGGKDWIALGFEPLDIDKEVVKRPPGRVTDREAHTGRRCQELSLFAPETIIRQITHYGTAKPGKRYQAGIWIKTNCPSQDAAAWISFFATNNAGGVVGRIGPSEKISGQTEWRWLSLEGVAPPGTQRLSLNLHTQGPTGTAWFDDAFIGEAESTRHGPG